MESDIELSENHDNEVTCVDNEYQELIRDCGIKLKTGLYLNEFLETNEAVIEPQSQDCNDSYTYYDNKDIVKHLNPSMLEQESDEDESDSKCHEERTPFGQLSTKMLDISGGDGGVLKKVEKDGVGEVVRTGAFVTIHYSCFLEYADEPYDSSYLRNKPLKFRLQSLGDKSTLIVGMEIGVRTMRVNETSLFMVQPEYAYGSMGCGVRIPRNAVLLIQVELLEMMDYGPAADFDHLSEEDRKVARFEEVLAAAEAEHVAGNDSFKKGSFHIAAKYYTKGVEKIVNGLPRNQEDEDAQRQLLLKLYLNLAQCFQQKHEFRQVLAFCDKASAIDNNNLKVLYRRGVALSQLGEFESARKELILAKRLSPYDKIINKALIDVDQKQCEALAREKSLCSAMFQRPLGYISDADSSSWSEKLKSDWESNNVASNDPFKDYIRQRLKEFLVDDTLKSIPYRSDLSFHELVLLSEVAEELGLAVSEVEKEGSRIIISKINDVQKD